MSTIESFYAILVQNFVMMKLLQKWVILTKDIRCLIVLLCLLQEKMQLD